MRIGAKYYIIIKQFADVSSYDEAPAGKGEILACGSFTFWAKYSPIGERVRNCVARLVQTRHAHFVLRIAALTTKHYLRMWRNWQTRMIQVHVGNHAGSSPVIRTSLAATLVRRSEKEVIISLPFQVAF